MRLPKNRYGFFGYGLVILVMLFSLYRANEQSVTHDEALTYREWVLRDWNSIRAKFSSNNHTLHSLAVKASTSLFDLSNMGLRLPAILGGLLYLIAAEGVCRLMFKRFTAYALSLSALVACPFVLDYMTVARGYSMALGFFMMALWQSRRMLALHEREGIAWLKGHVLMSLFCALSVASNLSFAFANLGLLLAHFLATFENAKEIASKGWWKRNWIGVVRLTIPGALLYLAINPGVFGYDKETMFFGARSWSDSLQSIVDAVFNQEVRRYGGEWKGFADPSVRILPLCMGGVLLVGLMLGLVKRLRMKLANGGALAERDGDWLYLGLTIGVTLGLHWLAFGGLGIWLPYERTGIFLYPLVLLWVAVSFEREDKGTAALVFRWAGRVVLGALIFYFSTHLNFNHHRYWKYDAGTNRVFEKMVEAADQDDGYLPIGHSWEFEPVFNFYREVGGYETLQRFTRDPPSSEQSVFAFVHYSQEGMDLIDELALEVIYTDPVSGAIVAVKSGK